jgi:glycosyltransferase involved in cell wall biosynthesis
VSRRVLFVTYFFPPIGGGGIERTLKHAAYLPDAGWQPVVVAPANPAHRLVDPATLARMPRDLEVRRVPMVEPAHLRLLLRRILRRHRPPAAPSFDQAAVAAPDPSRGALAPIHGALNAAWARIIPLVFVPDEQLLWVPPAIVGGWSAHRARPVEAVYSSAPPVSAHVAAGVLSTIIRRPWVADFRDPWIGNAFARKLPALQRRMQARIERWIVETAARLVFATPRALEMYAARYPARAAAFQVITNGYDLADLAADAAVPPADEADANAAFRLVYAGTIYGDDELTIFLDALELALERRPQLRERLRVDFVGSLNARNAAIAERRLPRLASVVRLLGQRPRTEAIARQRHADALLILLAGGPGRDVFVGGKVYEAIGLDKAVLAMAPPGETRRTLEELDWGIVVDPTPEAVAAGLERLVDTPPPRHIADPERRYDRRSLAQRLAGVLDAAVERTPPGAGSG